MDILQFKKKIRGLYTLGEWDVLVGLGKVWEPPKSITSPQSGIMCNRVDRITGRFCSAHLWDSSETVLFNSEIRRRMYCGVCGNGRRDEDELHRSIADR